MEFPVHPTFENCRRPTAAIDRNLAYMALVEILHGYPIDAVVLTTGSRQVDAVPGDGRGDRGHSHDRAVRRPDAGRLVRRRARRLRRSDLEKSEIAGRRPDRRSEVSGHRHRFGALVGHCNTMGTASTMNSLAEALGLSLTGCAAIPAPYRERGQIAYETGRRIVELAFEDRRPSSILTRDAFLDAIVVNAAIGG